MSTVNQLIQAVHTCEHGINYLINADQAIRAANTCIPDLGATCIRVDIENTINRAKEIKSKLEAELHKARVEAGKFYD
jgi:hypothetical protein